MRKEKGITLIALIITIIVMLILVGVTINAAINGGLLGKAEKVTFQTQVRQIQEGLQIRKAILLADNVGNSENIDSITIDELDIDQKLKTKFAQKLIIKKRADDFVLCYNPQNVTNQEKTWLEELNIFGTSFIEDVTEATAKNFDETYFWSVDTDFSGIRDLQAIHQDLKAQYPDAIFAYTYMLSSDGSVITFSSEDYQQIVNFANDYTALYNYAEETGKETISESDLTSEMLTIAEGLGVEFPAKVSTLYSSSVIARTLIRGSITLNIIYEDTHVFIAPHSELEDVFEEAFDTTKLKDLKKADIMAKEKAEEILVFEKIQPEEETGFGNWGLPLYVVGYEPNSYNITVPAYVVNSDNEMEVVKGIASEAFAMDSSVITTQTIKVNIIKQIQIEENMEVEHYTDLSLDNIKDYMSEITSGASDTIKDSYVEDTENPENNNNIKKEFMKESLGLMVGISKNDLEQYFVEEDGTMYAMMTFDTNGAPTNVYKIKDENGNLIDIEYVQYIENLTLKEGITEIGERAFAGNIIYTVSLPTTITDATNAFKDIMMITSIKWDLSMDEIRNIDGYNTGDGQFGLDGYVSDYLD